MRAVEGPDPQLFVHGADFARAVGPDIDRVYHTDALGTVEAITEGDQSVETRYLLNVWGETTGGYVQGNPYAYHGGLGYWSEPEVGLDYVRARWLDPATARWLSIDPVSGEARYSYARNNPLVYVDASGTQPTAPPRQWSSVQALLDALRKALGYMGETVGVAPEVRAIRETADLASELAREAVKDFLKQARKKTWFKNLNHWWKTSKTADNRWSWPAWLYNLTPQDLSHLDDYVDGFIDGLGDGVAGILEGLDPFATATALLDVITYLAEHPDKNLMDLAWSQIKPWLLLVWTPQPGLPDQKRGRLLGQLFIAAIALVLAEVLEGRLAGRMELPVTGEAGSLRTKRPRSPGSPPKPAPAPTKGKTPQAGAEGLANEVNAGAANPEKVRSNAQRRVKATGEEGRKGGEVRGNLPVPIGNFVSYASTHFSELALEFRKAHFRNRPQFRYESSNILVLKMEGVEEPLLIPNAGRGGPHAEEILQDRIRAGQIDPSRVEAIYSEREPCSAVCNGIMRRWFSEKLNEPGFLTWSWRQLDRAGKRIDDIAFRRILDEELGGS